MITRINNKKSGKTRTPYSFNFLKDPRTRVVVGLIFMLFSIYLLVSLVGFFFTGGMDQSLIDKETRELNDQPGYCRRKPGTQTRSVSFRFAHKPVVRSFVIHILLLAIYHRAAYCRTGYQEIRKKDHHQLCSNHLVFLVIGIYFHVLTHRIRIPGRGSRLFRVFLA